MRQHVRRTFVLAVAKHRHRATDRLDGQALTRAHHCNHLVDQLLNEGDLAGRSLESHLVAADVNTDIRELTLNLSQEHVTRAQKTDHVEAGRYDDPMLGV